MLILPTLEPPFTIFYELIVFLNSLGNYIMYQTGKLQETHLTHAAFVFTGVSPAMRVPDVGAGA